ncbi:MULTISPECIES: hypothetical protein [Pseudomonas]|uniref:hypothetical protein n=1 Tax=Pseudomonas TaxID=286 RepID=UPI001BE889E8|nr:MULTISPECIES: hypothetical protein [Pseudomonas]MBT2338832.1 hypothetical protein [Pseudomonas fluorescens]MCD4531980.1 hypothetical protein [Pseudomonas sp. C3-2018]
MKNYWTMLLLGALIACSPVAMALVLSPPTIETPQIKGSAYRLPWLSGTGVPGATVQVATSFTGSPVLGDATVGVDGRWQMRSAVALPVDAYSIVSKQSLNGDASDWGANVPIMVVDIIEPPVVNAPLQNGLTEPRLMFSGTGFPGATVYVVKSFSGDPLASTTVEANGHWAVRTATDLPLGAYSISSYQIVDGNRSDWGMNTPFNVDRWVTEGERVSKELNVLFAATNNSCGSNSAAFRCSGVLIRTVDYSPAFHSWNPSPSAINLGGVSFSYMRAGLGMDRLQGSRTQGLILEPTQSFADNAYPLQVLCAFPYDGESLRRDANGCGASYDFPQGSGPCIAQNISTLEAWRAHFQQYPSAPDRYRHQCSLGPDQAAYALSLIARENPSAETPDWQQNEIVIKTWPQNTSNLPIKAFFYFYTANGTAGAEAAKLIQQDFFGTTGRRVPVIRITPDATPGQVFNYILEDQGVL